MKILKIIIFMCMFMFMGCSEMINVTKNTEGKEVNYTGKIIDNACVVNHKYDMYEYSKTYPKEVALDCKIGYAIYTDNDIREFDQESNEKIEQYLKSPESTLIVVIKAIESNGVLHLIDIKKYE